MIYNAFHRDRHVLHPLNKSPNKMHRKNAQQQRAAKSQQCVFSLIVALRTHGNNPQL